MSNTNTIGKLPIRIEGIQPILSVKDMSTSRDFYIGLLGFEEEAWGNDSFTSISRDNAAIYLCKGAQGNPGTWLWIGFDGNIYSLYDELKAKGAVIRQPPVNYSWALEMHVEDPDGHVLRFGTEPDHEKAFTDKQNQTDAM